MISTIMNKSEKERNILLMRPSIPDRKELEPYLTRIWESRQLTNTGPIHVEFEEALCKYLGVENICLFANGTLALIFALKVLNLKGKVITTPFTSIATIQAIYWNNLTPVFADIYRSDLNIHADKIEAAITPDTSAIMPVHIFGNPCDVHGIHEVATRYNIKTVYDAAHCFGVKLEGIPVCQFGDLAVLSFHATKVFNTIEGGAIVCGDRVMKEHIDALKNIRLDNGLDNLCSGLNATMNEIQAAIGMVQLNHIDNIINLRKNATNIYLNQLAGIKGIEILASRSSVDYNYTYFPVIIDPVVFGRGRNDLADHFEKKGISTRKYFHPLVSDFTEFSMYKTVDLPVAEEISDKILCLPLYHDISFEEITYITDSIKQLSQNNQTV